MIYSSETNDFRWVPLTQPDQLPNIREEDVTNYFLHDKNPVTGGEKHCSMYLEKAKKYAVAPIEYIGQMGIYSDEENVYVRCNVRPSMKQGHYYTTVILAKDTGNQFVSPMIQYRLCKLYSLFHDS